MGRLSKADLVKVVADKTGLSRKGAERAVAAFMDAVREAVTRGETVRIPGFGTFAVRERAARQGRDIKTGEPITVPARKAVVFRAGEGLKRAVAV
ncbi:HU family DNA-binding protein [Desulfofundulus thermosubterraneus]|uniref:DNA-binding protein HU-beta n=1 Tax=Desulfofundulus thermosubterraneus DSM 16057 TaxID=1121432 RepID=A0A1M6M3T9_9FIRM|nr:HU family DNA-binding protein [Desulfofundulus thermosubterraneus]SHJ78051.1 DNA-binding protein HU-beta [Desulfofundulus thermosubterraneus DSM 16057]